MSITLSREGNSRIMLHPGFPPSKHLQCYPLLDHYHAQFSSLLVIQQKWLQKKGIYHLDLTGTVPDTLIAQYNRGVILLHISLDNSITYTVEGLEPITLHQRGMVLYYVPFWLAHVRTGFMHHRSLIICLPPDALEPYRSKSLPVANLLQHAATLKPYQLFKHPHIVHHSLLNLIETAMESPDTFELTHHLETVVESALDHLTTQPRPKAVTLHLEDVEKMYEVKDLVVNNLDTIYSLQQISEALNITRWKLRNWFPMIFGVSIQDFSQQVRMGQATRLLRKGEKHQSIAKALGYFNANTFRTAFSNYYDCSTSQYLAMCR